MTVYVFSVFRHFLPKTEGSMRDTRKPITTLIAHPTATAVSTCPTKIPMIRAIAEGVSPKYKKTICTITDIVCAWSLGSDSEINVPTTVAKKLIERTKQNHTSTFRGFALSITAATIIGSRRSIAVTERLPRIEYKSFL